MTVKSSISLTDQQNAFARSLVQEGRYSSLSAVIQQGLNLLRTRTEADQVTTDALRVLLQQRRTGRFISPEQMQGRVDGMLKRKRREHGPDR